MSDIASINFKKSNAIQTQHNDRIMPPSHLIGLDVQVNRSSKEANNLRNAIIANAIEAYQAHTKQKFQAKSYLWSAVANIKETTTMQDLERLADHFKAKYGFQCYQIAIHRDEGHIDEYGTTHINHHAHLEFVTLDENMGLNKYQRKNITPKVLREIQTETANILGMQRGTDVRQSGVKRIEPRAYAQLAEKAKAERKYLKDCFNDWAHKKIQETDNLQHQLQQTQQAEQDLKAQYEKEKQARERLEQELQATKTPEQRRAFYADKLLRVRQILAKRTWEKPGWFPPSPAELKRRATLSKGYNPANKEHFEPLDVLDVPTLQDLKQHFSQALELLDQELEQKRTEAELTAKELTEKQIRERIEQERKEWIAQRDHSAQEYRELRAIAERYKTENSTLKLTKEQLETAIAQLNAKHAELKKQNAQLEAQNAELKKQNAQLEAQNAELKTFKARYTELQAELAKSKVHHVHKKDATGNPIPVLGPYGNQRYDQNGDFLWETEWVHEDYEKLQEQLEAEKQLSKKLQQEAANRIEQLATENAELKQQNQFQPYQPTPKKGRGR